MSQSVLIVGAGSGLSASLARRFHAAGMQVALAARDGEKARATPDLVVYNPSARLRGPVTELDPEATRAAIETTCFGAFLVAQQAARQMLARGSGSILFTGASAGVKGFANSSVFAMGKFGLRGLAQSLARELHPQNIHIGHFVIDGGIASERQDRKDDGSDRMLDPDAIAEAYLQFHARSHHPRAPPGRHPSAPRGCHSSCGAGARKSPVDVMQRSCSKSPAADHQKNDFEFLTDSAGNEHRNMNITGH